MLFIRIANSDRQQTSDYHVLSTTRCDSAIKNVISRWSYPVSHAAKMIYPKQRR